MSCCFVEIRAAQSSGTKRRSERRTARMTLGVDAFQLSFCSSLIATITAVTPLPYRPVSAGLTDEPLGVLSCYTKSQSRRVRSLNLVRGYCIVGNKRYGNKTTVLPTDSRTRSAPNTSHIAAQTTYNPLIISITIPYHHPIITSILSSSHSFSTAISSLPYQITQKTDHNPPSLVIPLRPSDTLHLTSQIPHPTSHTSTLNYRCPGLHIHLIIRPRHSL